MRYQGAMPRFWNPFAWLDITNLFRKMDEMAAEVTTRNTLQPRQNGRHCADDTLKRIFLNENVRVSIKISLKFVPMGPINNIPALVQIMAWRRKATKATSHYVNQWWLDHRRIYALLGLNEIELCIRLFFCYNNLHVNMAKHANTFKYSRIHYRVCDEITYSFPNFDGCLGMRM